MSAYTDMTTAELRDATAGMLAEVERREVEETARAAVDEAVAAYADSQGLTVLQAWRALAPEGVEVPDDPEPVPVPDAPEWVAPTGAHDAYMIGDLVTYNGKVYRCLMDNCVWSPAAYARAWEEIG